MVRHDLVRRIVTAYERAAHGEAMPTATRTRAAGRWRAMPHEIDIAVEDGALGTRSAGRSKPSSQRAVEAGRRGAPDAPDGPGARSACC